MQQNEGMLEGLFQVLLAINKGTRTMFRYVVRLPNVIEIESCSENR